MKKRKVKARKRKVSTESRQVRQLRAFGRDIAKAVKEQKELPTPERRLGHSALRLRDGRLEVFDPHPGLDDSTPETDEFTRYRTRTPVEWFHFARSLELRLRGAQREYKKGWDAFYALRRSTAQKDYPLLTQVVRPK